MRRLMVKPRIPSNDACKFSPYCFLNCKGCLVVDAATKEELADAKDRLEEHRKRLKLIAI